MAHLGLSSSLRWSTFKVSISYINLVVAWYLPGAAAPDCKQLSMAIFVLVTLLYVRLVLIKLLLQYVCYQSAPSSSNCSFGVLRGSVLGPVLFYLYLSPIASIASCNDVQLAQYADNTQIYVALPNLNINTHQHNCSTTSVLPVCLTSLVFTKWPCYKS